MPPMPPTVTINVVAAILRRGELKRIERIESGGEYRAAAVAYLDYTKSYGPQDETLWERALYNAGVDFGPRPCGSAARTRVYGAA